MSEITARPEPRTVALSLVRQTALDEAARHTPGPDSPPAPNWEMHHDLTAALEDWRARATLREDSLLLMEWLATELCAFLLHQLGDQAQLERWLRDFGDEVCRTQQHAHPAGPTAIEILSAVASNAADRPEGPGGTEHVVRIATPYLHYLRADHEVEDAREVALTFALWAGSQLAALLHNRLTVNQANCLADVLNDTLITPGLAGSAPLVFSECADAFQLVRDAPLEDEEMTYGAKWDIDEEALLSYLRSLGPTADHALHDAVNRWWTRNEQATVDGWAAVGLTVHPASRENADRNTAGSGQEGEE